MADVWLLTPFGVVSNLKFASAFRQCSASSKLEVQGGNSLFHQYVGILLQTFTCTGSSTSFVQSGPLLSSVGLAQTDTVPHSRACSIAARQVQLNASFRELWLVISALGETMWSHV